MMDRYAVCVDKLLFFIYTDIGERDHADIISEIPIGAYALLLFPSNRADLRVECHSTVGDAIREIYLPFVALSYFFSAVRGLPDTELDIEYSGGIYTLDIPCERVIKFDKIPFKGKQSLSKTVTLADNSEIVCYDVAINRVIRVISACSADTVPDGYLRSLLIREGVTGADAVIAASYDKEIRLKATDNAYPLESCAAGVLGLVFDAVIPSFGEYTVRLFGAAHRLQISDGELRFFINVIRLL